MALLSRGPRVKLESSARGINGIENDSNKLQSLEGVNGPYAYPLLDVPLAQVLLDQAHLCCIRCHHAKYLSLWVWYTSQHFLHQVCDQLCMAHILAR